MKPMTVAAQADRLSLFSVGVCLLLSVILATSVAVWPKAGQPVGVVFAPWLSQGDVMTRVFDAGGTVVEFGATANIVVAVGSSAGFYANLFSQGALVLLDGSLTSAFCNTASNK